LLYGEPLSEPARARLKVIYESTNGFEIAERDLELRGPGEYLGERQSGEALLRFADLERDGELVDQAIAAASEMLERHPAAARAHGRSPPARSRLGRRWRSPRRSRRPPSAWCCSSTGWRSRSPLSDSASPRPIRSASVFLPCRSSTWASPSVSASRWRTPRS